MPVTAEQNEYWFARRFPLDDRRKSMAPVHWKGWLCAWIFVAGMAIGALAFAWMAIAGLFVWGVATFVIAAFVAGAWFITVAVEKGDHRHTIAEYRRGGVA